jgi:hypothetical protein
MYNQSVNKFLVKKCLTLQNLLDIVQLIKSSISIVD